MGPMATLSGGIHDGICGDERSLRPEMVLIARYVERMLSGG